MTDNTVTGPKFSAIGVVRYQGQELYADEMEFDLSGVRLILQRDGNGGFEVARRDRAEPGFAVFEKSCVEPVSFLVMRDGKAYHHVKVVGMFDAMRLPLPTD